MDNYNLDSYFLYNWPLSDTTYYVRGPSIDLSKSCIVEPHTASSSKEHKNYSGDHWGGAPSSELDGWAEEGERVRKVEKKSSHRDNKAQEKEERGGDGGHRSSKERSQREESVASNSSQGSVGSSSRKESPATSSSDRGQNKGQHIKVKQGPHEIHFL